MAKQILGTFQSRDAADAVKDALMAEGFQGAQPGCDDEPTLQETTAAGRCSVGGGRVRVQPGMAGLRGEGGQGGAEDDGKEATRS